MSKLRVENLTVCFGGLYAVNDVSFETREGEILSVVGPNGAGKTTLFNAITKYVKPTSGKVFFDEKDITSKQIHEISEAGIIRTFQKRSYFPSLTVLENVLMGQHLTLKPSLVDFVMWKQMQQKNKHAVERAKELLEFVGLGDVRDSVAGLLPYGKQRLLGVAIALASNPKLLLLDEPCAGSNPNECSSMIGVIEKINETGIPIILVEHHMKVVMQLSKRVIVINSGKKMVEGTPQEIQCNEEVIEAYLGKRGKIEHA
ncbi:MAG: ABC transporter ATP-binding protein [Bacillota bacterium]